MWGKTFRITLTPTCLTLVSGFDTEDYHITHIFIVNTSLANPTDIVLNQTLKKEATEQYEKELKGKINGNFLFYNTS